MAFFDRPLERRSPDYGKHSGEFSVRRYSQEEKARAHQKLKEARLKLLFDRCAENPDESFEPLAMKIAPLPLTPSDKTINLSEIREFEEEIKVAKAKWDAEVRLKTKSIWQTKLWHKLQQEDARRRERERSKYHPEEPIL